MTAPLRTSVSLPLLTSSRLKDARACARLDHYKYGLGYRAIEEENENLTLGTLVHAGLEAWWSTLAGEPLIAAIAAVRAREAEPYAKAKAEALLVGYHVRWFPTAGEYETIAVEQEFRTALCNPVTGAESKTFALGGKMDAVVRERSTGRTLIVEHKTAGEDITAGSVYWRRLRMDGQVSIYFAGAAALGYDAAGCLYDVIGKPKQRPLQANKAREIPETPEQYRERLIEAIACAPDAYYQRGEVARLSDDLAEAAADHWSTAQVLRDNARLSRHARNVDSCLRYGRVCEFFSVCSGEVALDDAHRFRRLDNPHADLAGNASTPKEEAPCPSLP